MSKNVSKKLLAKCLNTLISRSKHNFVTEDKWIAEYASDPAIYSAIRALTACGAISCKYFDGSDTPSIIIIQNDAFLLLHQIYNDKKEFIKGYILGIISAVFSGVLINLITAALQ